MKQSYETLSTDPMLSKLERLAQETFDLWDETRIGFSWRHYYFNHTQRIRNLSLEIGRREGADLRKLAYAALLHDITKRYDGSILTDSHGNRVLDNNGFWRNELILPKRQNRITELYEAHQQLDRLHNQSGAVVASKLLEEWGLATDFCEAVASIIEAHLRPNGREEIGLEDIANSIESKVLYDADIIDANLGLVAFFRNAQIHAGRMILQTGTMDLKAYLSSIPKWLQMKEDFVSKVMTSTGRFMAQARQQRNIDTYASITEEMKDWNLNIQWGIIGVFGYFMEGAKDPDLSAQMNHLKEVWLPKRRDILEGNSKRVRDAWERAGRFCTLLEQEIAGTI